MTNQQLTGVERKFADDEILVSKTDIDSRLTYANDVFIQVSGYSEDELLGQPHNLIRHPDMPKCIFKLLWDTIQSGNEIFAYVINRAKNGDHYWVYAHVTPWFDAGGKIAGYHSSRRSAEEGLLKQTIIPLYGSLRAEEAGQNDSSRAMAAALRVLDETVEARGFRDYEEFIHRLT